MAWPRLRACPRASSPRDQRLRISLRCGSIFDGFFPRTPTGPLPYASSRAIFSFHRPETLSEWLKDELVSPGSAFKARLASMPSLLHLGLWPAQFTAIDALENSLAHGRRRSLIQMATGSGKTYTSCNAIYRLIKFASQVR